MPYSTDSPPEAARKYKPKCQRACVHAFNSVHDRTKDEGKAMAAGHAAARRCEGKQASMSDVKFNIYSGLLKAYESPDGIKRLKTTASSTIRDLSGDTMTLKAIEKMAETAKQGMTIFLNHKYQVPEDVLGTVEDAVVVQRGAEIWDMDLDIRVEESNPRAVKTHEAVTNGTKLGTSIGALIPEGGAKRTDDGLLIDDVRLLEASIVGIPANPRSFVQYAVKAYHDAEEELEDVEGTQPPKEGMAWDTKAKVWVTVDTEDTAEAPETETPKAKPAGKAKDTKKDEEPDVTKDAEELETPAPDTAPDADAPSDTEDEGTGDNEAATEQPETDAPATQEAPDESAPESDGDGDETASELMGKSVDVIIKTLQDRTEALADERQKNASLTSEVASLEAELREAKEGLKLAQNIVERISALPIGKRAGFSNEVTDFRTKFGQLYDPEFLKMLEKP
jgi:hypothetical protein